MQNCQEDGIALVNYRFVMMLVGSTCTEDALLALDIGISIPRFPSAIVSGNHAKIYKTNDSKFSGFGLHAGENISGTIAVTDKRCFDRIVTQIERKSTSEKFDVVQCRKCIFNSCWLGTRILPDQRTYLTNLRSY
jgi:hypothetical protein